MRIESYFKYMVTLILTVISLQILEAQQPGGVDKLVMMNGEEKIGKVTEIADTYIKFVHEGEDLVYSFKREQVNKIQFASGRIEFITDVSKASSLAPTMQDHHNVIAILPFSYIGSGGSRDEKMGFKAQSDCYGLLKKYAKQFTIQDPTVSNAVLIKNGVKEDNLAGFTPAEIANIMGAEYIVYCTISINQQGSTTTGGNVYTEKDKGKKKIGWTGGTSTTTANFATSVDMKIYSDQGQSIFTQSHESFWPTEDAYIITLQYLVKRTPLYNK